MFIVIVTLEYPWKSQADVPYQAVFDHEPTPDEINLVIAHMNRINGKYGAKIVKTDVTFLWKFDEEEIERVKALLQAEAEFRC